MRDGETATAKAAVNPNLPSVSISAPSNTMSTSTSGLSGEEIYAKVSPSVVSVQAVSLQNGKGGTGSGVIMSADGYIITNQHVVTNENTGAVLDKITVVMSDGTNLPAAVKGVDQQTDLAVLKVEPAGIQLTPAEFGDSNNLKPGEEVFAIGSPGGLELANTITGGHISALNRDITIDDRVMSLIQTDAAINPGNSGGALINKYGQVIGITSAKLGISYFEGLGFAIPMDTAKPIVDELIQFGYIAGRPQIGISGRNVSEQTAAAYGIPQGVQIALVDSRSNAAAAGIQVNDIIVGINGKTITNMDEINAVKDSLKAGDKITLKLYRISTGKRIFRLLLRSTTSMTSRAQTRISSLHSRSRRRSGITTIHSAISLADKMNFQAVFPPWEHSLLAAARTIVRIKFTKKDRLLKTVVL